MANRAPFSSADFRAMEPADLHYGRGRRESQVTERMQEFRKDITRKPAHVQQTFSGSEVPPMSPLRLPHHDHQVASSPLATKALTAEELQELEADPTADLDYEEEDAPPTSQQKFQISSAPILLASSRSSCKPSAVIAPAQHSAVAPSASIVTGQKRPHVIAISDDEDEDDDGIDVTQCPFPGQPDINEMAASAWLHGCDDMGISFPIDDEKLKIIKNRASQVRGALKIVARPIVLSWGFKSAPSTDRINKNRSLYKKLHDNAAFIFKDPNNISESRGMYANTAILEVIERAFFVDLKDEGILFPEYFDAPGIPIVLIALVAAVLGNALDEWKTGSFVSTDFTEKKYLKKYNYHLTNIQDWLDFTEKSTSCATKKLQETLLENVQFAAGVKPDEDTNQMRPFTEADFAANEADFVPDEAGSVPDDTTD